ncbi:hypothetical protein RLOatenuis_3050 [Rickettsiales bacterium]|nr:hypothetical protein RLOatenuis_3050 [Rickettsiales bacterium]
MGYKMAPPEGFNNAFKEQAELSRKKKSNASVTVKRILDLKRRPAEDLNWQKWTEALGMRYNKTADRPDILDKTALISLGMTDIKAPGKKVDLLVREYNILADLILSSKDEEIKNAETKGNKDLFFVVEACKILQKVLDKSALDIQVPKEKQELLKQKISEIDKAELKYITSEENTLSSTEGNELSEEQEMDWDNEFAQTVRLVEGEKSKPLKGILKKGPDLWGTGEPHSSSSKNVDFDLSLNQIRDYEPKKQSSEKRKGFIAAAVISSILCAGAGAFGGMLLLSSTFTTAALIGTGGVLAVAFPWVFVGIAAVLAVTAVVTAYKAHHSKDDNTKELGQELGQEQEQELGQELGQEQELGHHEEKARVLNSFGIAPETEMGKWLKANSPTDELEHLQRSEEAQSQKQYSGQLKINEDTMMQAPQSFKPSKEELGKMILDATNDLVPEDLSVEEADKAAPKRPDGTERGPAATQGEGPTRVEELAKERERQKGGSGGRSATL